MKIYRLTVLAFAALAAMTFSSCSSSDADVVTTQKYIPGEIETTTPTIVFSFTSPGGSPLHYTNTRAVGDPLLDSDIDEEATIKSLYMYEFDAATDKFVSKTDISAILTQNSTSGSNIGGKTGGTSAKNFTYEYRPFDSSTGVTVTHNNDARLFLFVANYSKLSDDIDSKEASDAGSTTLSWVRNQITNAMVQDGGTSNYDQKSVWDQTDDVLPMTAFAMVNNSDVISMEKLIEAGTNVITAQVDLTRIVARVDVVNNTPELIIEDIRLIKANDRSYLLANTASTTRTSALPTGNTKQMIVFDKTKVFAPATGTKPYLDMTYDADRENASAYLASFELPTANIGDPDAEGVVVKKTVKLEQAFYVYEDIAREASDNGESLHILVRGTLKGIQVSYNIPFTNDLVEGNDPATTAKNGFAIKRNHLYTVVLGDGKPAPINTNIKAKIKVLDWDQQIVTDYFDASVFKVYAEDVDNSLTQATPVDDTEAELVIATKVINVIQKDASDATQDLEFVLASPYTEVNKVVANIQSVDGDAAYHDWITITPLDANVDGSPKDTNKGYKITVKPNTSVDPAAIVRSATIKVEYYVNDGTNNTKQTNISYTITQANS